MRCLRRRPRSDRLKKAMETALLAFLGFGAAVFTLGAWMYASLSQDRSR